jgi:hypothetical protein
MPLLVLHCTVPDVNRSRSQRTPGLHSRHQPHTPYLVQRPAGRSDRAEERIEKRVTRGVRRGSMREQEGEMGGLACNKIKIVVHRTARRSGRGSGM